MFGYREAFIDAMADKIEGALFWGPGAEASGLDGKGDGHDKGLG